MRDGIRTNGIGLADHLTASHSAASEQREECPTPVVSSSTRIHFGGSTKLTEHYYHRIAEQAPSIQIIQQCRYATIQGWKHAVFQGGVNVAVVVPVLNVTHVGLYNRDSCLDQTTCQQERLTVSVPAITIAYGKRFPVQFKGLTYFPGGQYAECLFLLSVIVRASESEAPCRFWFICSSKARRSLRRLCAIIQMQAPDPEIGPVRVLPDVPGIVLGAEKTGVLSRPDERPFHQECRQCYPRGYAVVIGSEVIQSGSITRPIVSRGNLIELAARNRRTRQDLMGCQKVIVFTMSERPNQAQWCIRVATQEDVRRSEDRESMLQPV